MTITMQCSHKFSSRCLLRIVTWQSSMSCDEFQDHNVDDLENTKWRQWQMCERMIELKHGGYHMTCWCGHELRKSYGPEYTESDDFTQNFSSSPAVEDTIGLNLAGMDHVKVSL
ncbi:probable E3 ubiquitin-protein ligase ARI10 [Tanacetum coccineum]